MMSLTGKIYLKFSLLVSVFLRLSSALDNDNIDVDYFFGSELRSTEKLSCDNPVLKFLCTQKCGAHFTCVSGQCTCLDTKRGKKFLKHIIQTESSDDYVDSSEFLKRIVQTKSRDNNVDSSHVFRNHPEDHSKEMEDRPALRHHIAHFCPNLAEARACIRKCMKKGKPAFCGKDHVCYCGHSYGANEENTAVDPNDAYAEFRDLYEKYFGPQVQTSASEEQPEPPTLLVKLENDA